MAGAAGAIDSAIGVIGNLASMGIGHALQGDLMGQQYRYNRRLMQEQNQWNLDMWNRSNDYNTPEAQVQRYRDAGLNAGMMMSNNSQAGTATPITGTGASVGPAPQPAGMFNMGDTILSALLTEKNIKKTEADIRNIDADTYSKQLNNIFNEESMDDRLNTIKKDNNLKDEQVNQIKQNIDNLKQELINLGKQGQIFDDQLIKNMYDLLYYPYEKSENLNILKNTNKEIKARINNLNVDNSVKRAMIPYYNALTELQQALTTTEGTKQDLNQALSGLYGSQKKLIDIDVDTRSLMNIFNLVESGSRSFKNVTSGVHDISDITQDWMLFGLKKLLFQNKDKLDSKTRTKVESWFDKDGNPTNTKKTIEGIDLPEWSTNFEPLSSVSHRNPDLWHYKNEFKMMT